MGRFIVNLFKSIGDTIQFTQSDGDSLISRAMRIEARSRICRSTNSARASANGW